MSKTARKRNLVNKLVYWVVFTLVVSVMVSCGSGIASAGTMTVTSPTSTTAASPVQFAATTTGPVRQMAVILDGVTIYQQKVTSVNFTKSVANGTHTVQFKFQSPNGGWSSKFVTFTIPVPPPPPPPVPPLVFVTTSLPDGVCTSDSAGGWLVAPYSYQLVASGGTPPYTFSLPSGTLPPGLTVSSSGLISGNIDCLAIFGLSALNKGYSLQFALNTPIMRR